MRKIILLSILCFAYRALCKDSGNVVGYISESVVGQGMTVNRFQQPSGGPPKLAELMPDAPLGTEIAFFDGVEWVTAVADEGNDGTLHWLDKRNDDLADNYEVPIGAGIKYKLPEGERGSFMFNGEVRESYMDGAAAVFDGGISLDEVRLPRDKVSEILKPQIVVTNNVVVTNQPPNRFAVRLKSGELYHAMWMADTLAICDPASGLELKIPISSVTQFEVDDAAPQKLRMDKEAVVKVEQFYLAEVVKERQRQEEARQKKTETGIAKSVKEDLVAMILQFKSLLFALVGMLFSAVISYYVGKMLDRLHRRKHGGEGESGNTGLIKECKPNRNAEEAASAEAIVKRVVQEQNEKSESADEHGLCSVENSAPSCRLPPPRAAGAAATGAEKNSSPLGGQLPPADALKTHESQ